MTGITFEDRTGMLRDSKDFTEAKTIILNRMVGGKTPSDIELFMQFTTILQALEIAEKIARLSEAKKNAPRS